MTNEQNAPAVVNVSERCENCGDVMHLRVELHSPAVGDAVAWLVSWHGGPNKPRRSKAFNDETEAREYFDWRNTNPVFEARLDPCAAIAAAPKPAAPPSVTDAVLRKVIHWAESRCPCHEETPDPCTLCGATVAEGRCKAVEEIFPRALLKELRAALAHDAQQEGKE